MSPQSCESRCIPDEVRNAAEFLVLLLLFADIDAVKFEDDLRDQYSMRKTVPE